MHTKLSIPERLKDLRVVDKHLTLEQLAEQCRFRDCTHHEEPGCAVRAAVESSELTPERYASYQALQQEMAAMRDRREEARRMNKEKVSDTKRRRAGAPKGGRRRR